MALKGLMCALPGGNANRTAGFVPYATHWVISHSFTDRGTGELSVLNEQCYGTSLFWKI